MRRLVTLLLLLIAAITPLTAHLAVQAGPVYADEAYWESDPPKQVGMPVLWCTASASAGGDTYTMKNYVPIDDDFDEQRYAQRVFTEDVKRAMLFRFPGRPHEIQDRDVKVACSG